MFENVRRVINESYTFLANEYFKGLVRFYGAGTLPVFTTTDRLALGAIPEGTVVWDSTIKMAMVYSGTGWQYMSMGCEASDS